MPPALLRGDLRDCDGSPPDDSGPQGYTPLMAAVSLADEILAGPWFGSGVRGYVSTPSVARRLIAHDPHAIERELAELVTAGVLELARDRRGEQQVHEGFPMYRPVEPAASRRHEEALRGLDRRSHVVLHWRDYELADVVLALAHGKASAAAPPGYLGDEPTMSLVELRQILFDAEHADVVAAMDTLVSASWAERRECTWRDERHDGLRVTTLGSRYFENEVRSRLQLSASDNAYIARASRARTVFYSWQSSRPNRTNRGLIQAALERATKRLIANDSVRVEPVIDRDTAGCTGAPDIAAAIFRKIDECTVFVADVTPVHTVDGRSVPNPNVLIELGYAACAVGWDRVIMVVNVAFGRPEELPFDLRGRLVVSYEMPDDPSRKPADARERLSGGLEAALRPLLKS